MTATTDSDGTRLLLRERQSPFSPWGEGARRADEGACFAIGRKVPPHQFGRMTYGRAMKVLPVGRLENAAVSHGLTSSPRRGEAGTTNGSHLECWVAAS